MTTYYKNLLIGFIAGAIAVITAHEIINFVLLQAGLFPRVPWSMKPAVMTAVPQIVSDMFWGGLWGSLFAAIHERIPGGSLPVKGLLFGLIGPALIGVFVLVPLLKGGSLFLGGDPKLILGVLLILGGFGAALGWLYRELPKYV